MPRSLALGGNIKLSHLNPNIVITFVNDFRISL